MDQEIAYLKRIIIKTIENHAEEMKNERASLLAEEAAEKMFEMTEKLTDS